MTRGEDVGGGTSAARADFRRRAAFPALVIVLALFCVEGLQLLSSVVHNDLASPPLVEVPSIDLRSAPPPVRPTAVAGAIVEADAQPTDPAVTAVAVGGLPPLPAPDTAVPASSSTATVVAATALPDDGRLSAAAVGPANTGPAELTAASGGDDGRPSERKALRRRPPGRSGFVPPGPPPGRPVGPDCDDVPGRRAACDRRPTSG